jgi:hypothetical protein
MSKLASQQVGGMCEIRVRAVPPKQSLGGAPVLVVGWEWMCGLRYEVTEQVKFR